MRHLSVIEKADIVVVDGRADEFADVLPKALPLLQNADGCIRASASRGVENPGTYLLLVEWTSVAAHTSFARTAAFGEFVGQVKEYFAAPPGALHYAPLDA